MCLSALAKFLDEKDRKKAIKIMVKNGYRRNLFFLLEELPSGMKNLVLAGNLKNIFQEIEDYFLECEDLLPVEVGKDFISGLPPERLIQVLESIRDFILEHKPKLKKPIFKFNIDEIKEQLAILVLTIDSQKVIKCNDFIEAFDIYNKYYEFSSFVYRILRKIYPTRDVLKKIFVAEYMPQLYKKVITTMLVSGDVWGVINTAMYLKESGVDEQEFKKVLETFKTAVIESVN